MLAAAARGCSRFSSLAGFYLQQSRAASTLVLCEPRDNGSLALSSLNTITAAAALGNPVTALLAGQGVEAAAEQASKVQGVAKVLLAQHASLQHQLAEPLSSLLVALQNKRSFTHILAPGSSFGKNVLPRAAALLGVQPVADITQVVDEDTFVRPIYAGNALATVRYSKPGLRMITVRTSSFPPAPTTSSSSSKAEVEAVSQEELQAAASVPSEQLPTWVSAHSAKSERPELGSARVVVCGGRALKSAEGFQILESLADALGGAVGASRAAVDAGYVPNDLQVGQTGKVISPDLYIGIGISGAIQHLAGIKDSKVIVAINNDEDAPIFQVADYGLVADLFQAVPEMEAEVRKLKA